MTNVLASDSPSEFSAQIKTPVSTATKPASKSKPRKRVNTAEKRHQHNAIERQRRETLNGKFISLARLLPSLAAHRRPSKSAIVNGSISHLKHQRNQRLLAAKLLRTLCAEHDSLLTEVNEWRKANGFAPKEPVSAWTDEVDEVLSVEKESFGSFAAGFDGEDGDEGDDDVSESVVSRPSFALSNGGLITPRTSTDSASSFDHHNVYSTMPAPEHRSVSVAATAVNWSGEFDMGINGSGSVAFNSIMSRPNEHSPIGDSPDNSQHGVTPPTYTDILHAGQTPSARSSDGASGFEEQRPMDWANVSLGHLPQQRAAPGFPQAFPGGTPDPDTFTQQLMASMFGGNVSQENVEQWRRNALGAGVLATEEVRSQTAPTSVHDLRNAVRLGMGVGFRLQGNAWSPAVEGF